MKRFPRIFILMVLGVLMILCTSQAHAQYKPLNSTTTAPNFTSRSDGENKVLEMLRLVHSVEASYISGAGNGSFGTPADLFKAYGLPPALANALGIPKMTSAEGQLCPGTGEALNGYKFIFTGRRDLTGKMSRFTVLAIIAHPAQNQAGNRNFFINQTGVIRFAPNPGHLPNAQSLEVRR